MLFVNVNIKSFQFNLYLLFERREDILSAFIRSSPCLIALQSEGQCLVECVFRQQKYVSELIAFIHALSMEENSSPSSLTASLSSDHENKSTTQVGHSHLILATSCNFSLLSHFEIWLYTYLCVCMCVSLAVSWVFVEREWTQEMYQMYREKSNEWPQCVQTM